MNEHLRYLHPTGRSYAELMSGKRFVSNGLGMASGTLVELVGYDEDSAWPMVNWIDNEGATRTTTIDPVIFVEYFIPEL